MVRTLIFVLILVDLKNVTISSIEWKEAGSDPQVRVATLKGTQWLALESPHLFVRKCYDRLWDYIHDSFLDRLKSDKDRKLGFERVLIRGNSGIGKTASLNYFLIRALQNGIRVLFEDHSNRFFFDGTRVESECLFETGLIKYRNYRDVLVLHVHQPGSEPPLIFNGAFVVAPVSPDPKLYHQYSKHRVLNLWMPLTTADELVAMNSVEPKLEASELQRRIATYGPLPCPVFSVGQRAMLDKLTGMIYSFELGRKFLRMLSRVELHKPGFYWWIVHIDATEDLQGVSKIHWASEDIFNRVIARISADRLSELEDYIARTLRVQFAYLSPPAAEYQRWAALKIATGIPFRYYFLEEAKGVVVPSGGFVEESLPPTEAVAVTSLNDESTLLNLDKNRGTVYYSTGANEPLCDAAAMTGDTLYLFQMTIGNTYRLTSPTLANYVTWVKQLNEAAAEENASARITKVWLVFVVPRRDGFSLPKSVRTMVPREEGLAIDLVVSELQPQTSLYRHF